MFLKRNKKMKWIYSMKWTTHEWAQRDYDALNLDPEIDVLEYGSAPVFDGNGSLVGHLVFFWVETTIEKYMRVKETLKETYTEDLYNGFPILKCSMNVERVEIA